MKGTSLARPNISFSSPHRDTRRDKRSRGTTIIVVTTVIVFNLIALPSISSSWAQTKLDQGAAKNTEHADQGGEGQRLCVLECLFCQRP